MIERVEATEKTPKRHHHSGHCQGKLGDGQVLAVGAGVRDDSGRPVPLDVKPGDRVLFAKWVGREVLIDREERLILKGDRHFRRDREKTSRRRSRLGFGSRGSELAKVRSLGVATLTAFS
jgi:chaperonin GroES